MIIAYTFGYPMVEINRQLSVAIPGYYADSKYGVPVDYQRILSLEFIGPSAVGPNSTSWYSANRVSASH
jgi:hypothetical protein